MRKSQKIYRSTNKQLCKVIQNRFNNVSLSDLQTKNIMNKATNYGKHKTDDATIYQIALDTLKEDKPFKNMVHLGRQLEETKQFYKTVYICSNLPKIDFDGLGVAHQTHNERMRAKTTLKAFKSDINRNRYISKQSD